MRRLAALALVCGAAGCGASMRDVATRSANGASAVVDAARPYVDACEVAYASGTGRAHVESVDASGCLALLRGVDAARAAQLALRIVAMAPSEPSAPAVLALAGEATEAAEAVSRAVASLRTRASEPRSPAPLPTPGNVSRETEARP